MICHSKFSHGDKIYNIVNNNSNNHYLIIKIFSQTKLFVYFSEILFPLTTQKKESIVMNEKKKNYQLESAIGQFVKGLNIDENRLARKPLFLEGDLKQKFFTKRVASRGQNPVDKREFKSEAEFNRNVNKKLSALNMFTYPNLNQSVDTERFFDPKSSKSAIPVKEKSAKEILNIGKDTRLLFSESLDETKCNRAIYSVAFKYDTYPDGFYDFNAEEITSFTPSVKAAGEKNYFSVNNMQIHPDALKAMERIGSLEDALRFMNDYGTSFLKELNFRIVHYEFLFLEMYSYVYDTQQLNAIGEELIKDVDFYSYEGDPKIGPYVSFVYSNNHELEPQQNMTSSSNQYKIKFKAKKVCYFPCVEPTERDWMSKLTPIHMIVAERYAYLKSLNENVDWKSIAKLMNEAYCIRSLNFLSKTKFYINKILEFQGSVSDLVNFDIDLYWQKHIYEKVERLFIGLTKICLHIK